MNNETINNKNKIYIYKSKKIPFICIVTIHKNLDHYYYPLITSSYKLAHTRYQIKMDVECDTNKTIILE